MLTTIPIITNFTNFLIVSPSAPNNSISFLDLIKATSPEKHNNIIRINSNFQSSFGLCILFNFFPISCASPICLIAFSSAICSSKPSCI